MNKRLMSCLGLEVLSVFELSEMMGYNKKDEGPLFPQEKIESLSNLPKLFKSTRLSNRYLCKRFIRNLEKFIISTFIFW